MVHAPCRLRKVPSIVKVKDQRSKVQCTGRAQCMRRGRVKLASTRRWLPERSRGLDMISYTVIQNLPLHDRTMMSEFMEQIHELPQNQ